MNNSTPMTNFKNIKMDDIQQEFGTQKKEPFDWKGMFTQTGDLLASLGNNNQSQAGNAPGVGANTHYNDHLGPLVSKYIDNTNGLKNLYGLLTMKG